MAVALLVLMLVKMVLDLIGADLSLMRERGVPAPGMLTAIWQVDEFGDNGLFASALQANPQDLSIAAPECLYLFGDLEASGLSGTENEV